MKKYISVAVVLTLLLGLSGEIFAAKKRVKIRTVAVMPFGTFAAGDLSINVTRVIEDYLTKNKFNVISQEKLESFLVKRRIRRTDFLDRPTIREMGTTLEADAVIMGSVDHLADAEDPQVAMSAQMIDCFDASVIWAKSVSHAGADFVTLLGLGKITSLEKLVEIAVDELLSGLPATVNVDSASVSPLEVIHAGFSPDVLRGGETARLSIEIREITGKLRDVKAFLLDTEIKLETEDGSWYTGTISAPAIEGVYPARIYITDRWNRLFSVEAAANLTVDNSPPEVALSFRQRLVSPNNDGINDSVVFFPEVLKAVILQSWRLEITNEGGHIVRSEDGIGPLPEGFIWRGEDNKNKIVKDGSYFCRLVVEDEAGNRTVTPEEMLMVDRTPPEVEIVLAREEEGITLDLRATDISKIAGWALIVYDRQGSEVGRFEGDGDIPATLTCAAKGPQPGEENLLTYSLEVSDVAGNRFQAKKQPLKLPASEIPESEPREKKEKIWLHDF